jgi:hypothetical protein
MKWLLSEITDSAEATLLFEVRLHASLVSTAGYKMLRECRYGQDITSYPRLGKLIPRYDVLPV